MFKLQIGGGQTKPISLSPFFRWSVLYTLYKESDMTQDIDLDVANCLKNKMQMPIPSQKMQQSTDHEQSTHYLIIDNHTLSWSCKWTKGLKIESTIVDSSSWICAWWCSAPTKSKFSRHDHHHTAIPDAPSFRKITKIPIPLQKSSSWVQSQSCRLNDCFPWNHSLPSQTLATKFTTRLILWKEGTRNNQSCIAYHQPKTE